MSVAIIVRTFAAERAVAGDVRQERGAAGAGARARARARGRRARRARRPGAAHRDAGLRRLPTCRSLSTVTPLYKTLIKTFLKNTF